MNRYPHPYIQEEMDAAFSRDHITEAYGPTADDAALCGIDEMIADDFDAGREPDPKLIAERDRLRARLGIIDSRPAMLAELDAAICAIEEAGGEADPGLVADRDALYHDIHHGD